MKSATVLDAETQRTTSLDAYFLERKWLRWIVLALIALLLGFWGIWIALVGGAFGEADTRIDFHDFWAAGSLASDGRSADTYNDLVLKEAQRDLPGADEGVFRWLYPPTFLLAVALLGWLPMVPAFVVWVASTAGVFLSAVRRIGGSWAVALALLMPATVFNLLIGQNGLLTAGILAWGTILLDRRPGSAGAILGMMAYKPQLFPMVLLALLIGRHWRAAISACVTALLVACLSLAILGPSTWEAFFDSATSASRDLYRHDSVAEMEKMASLTAMLRLAGAPGLAAQVTQVFVAALSAGAVGLLWWKQTHLEYRCAGLAVAILLVTPYAYQYDLTLLALAVMWLAIGLQSAARLRPGHWLVFACAILLPILGTALAQQTHFVIAPALLAVLLVIVLREGLGPPTSSSPRGSTSGVVA